MTRLSLLPLIALAAYAGPAAVSILSGTITVAGPGTPLGLTAQVDLTTATGSLNGTASAFSAFQDLFQLAPLTLNPSLFLGGDATMTIVESGVTYAFHPIVAGTSPDDFPGGSLTISDNITITAGGPLTFVMPFTADFRLVENNQFNAATEKMFDYTGPGTATVQFSRTALPGPHADSGLRFTRATYAFGSTTDLPEPSTGVALVIGGLAGLALRRRLSW